jgi:hypothetical protein
MFTPGTIIELSNNRFGLVIDSVDTCVKYLDITSDLGDIDPNSGIYNLLNNKVSFDRKIEGSLYLMLDVIHVADGEFPICGKMNTNQDFIEVMTYLNGYRNYSAIYKDTSEVIIQDNDAISLRKTV